MSTRISPPTSPLPAAPHTPPPIASTSSATHPHADNVYPSAKPTPTRRRSARLSISTPLPEWAASSSPFASSSTTTSPPAPAQQVQVAVPFPSDPLSSVPSTPNANATPSRARTRKRPRPSESGEVARRAVAALVTPSRKSQSPMREDGVTPKNGRTNDRGSEKKRRKVSPVRGRQQQVVNAMEVEAALPQVVARRVRTRSTAGPMTIEPSTSAPTPSTSAAPTPATATPARPNHRKRKSMSALDDIRRDLVFSTAEEQAIPQLTRKKLRKSVDVEGAGSAATVTFLVDKVGKGKGRDTSPTRGKRATRSTKPAAAPTSAKADIPMEDVEMAETPSAPETILKLRTRRSTRKFATLPSTPEPPVTAPSEPVTSPPSSPTPHTALGAAAAILASTSHVATLPPSALTSPSSSPTAPARRFTRSSLSINTQDPAMAAPSTSPLSSTSQLSPLSPPTSPLSSASALPLSPNQVASAQTQSMAPATLVAAVAASSNSGRASTAPVRRIATRSSGLPLIVAEWGVAAGSGRRRPSSPLAAVGSTVPESPEKEQAITEQVEGSAKGKEKEKEVVGGGKGKGKAGRKRGVGVTVKPSPSRRSSRLSGVEPPPTEQASTTIVQPAPQQLFTPVASPSPVQHQPQPQSHTPPSSPPSPPPLRLSLASLSPPMPASGHKPHTRSPLSASSSHQGQQSGATSPLKEGSLSPLKESASLSSIASGSSVGLLNSPPLGPSSNGKQPMQGPTMQSHTPPGSPTRGASMHLQMEIDAVDFGTPLPGPMQFNVQIQTSPPHQSQQQQSGSAAGKQVERPGSPTSPTERRLPVLPSTLLGVTAAPMRTESENVGERSELGKEKERGVEEQGSEASSQQAELAGAISVPGSSLLVSAEVVSVSSEPSLDENAPLQQQPLYPALIQVEIPPAPQALPQIQVEPGQQFADSTPAFQEQSEQQQEVQYQQQYAPPPPPPSYTQWEEPPRLDNERSLWRLACKVRVWDLRRRYSLETIRSLVTHEAHEYYAKNGFPAGYFSTSSSIYGSAGPSSPSGLNAAGLRTHASQLRAQALRRQVSGGSSSSEGDPTSPVNFMDEEVYDWEIATSDDEEGFIVEEDEDEDEEDYEDVYDDEEEEEHGEGEDPGPAPEEAGAESEKKEVGEEEEKDKEKERETSVEIEGENEEERLKRRRRRSSLLRHLRKPSGEFDVARSPSPAVQDDLGTSVEKEGDVEDEGEMDIDIDLDIEDLDEALEDPNFNLELSASTTASPTSPQQVSPASPSPVGSPTSGPSNGVFTSFYVPPVQQVFSPQSLPVSIADPSTSALSAALGTPAEAAASSPSPPAPASLLLDGSISSQPPPPAEALPPVQIPLQTIAIPMHIPSPSPGPPIIDMPPPRLSSVPVWALRNMEMSGGNMGKGTPVNRDRATEWGSVWSMDIVKSRAVSVMSLGEVDAGLIVQKDQDDFSMKVDRGNGSGSGGKPALRLSLPGEGDASSSGPAGTSASMGPSGSKQAMLMDGTFEPSNQADWEAFLASLAPPCGSSSSSSSLMGAQPMMQQGMPDHHQAPPPPYSSHNPNPLHGQQQSPPPTPTPPSPVSSTSSLHENVGALGGGSMTIHSPGTSQAGTNGMMNPAGMFGMMNVNMMFGVPGSQGGGNAYPQQMQQPQPHSQAPMQPQQAVNDGSQPSFPAMGLTMQMPPPTMNSMGPQHGSYNNSGMQQSFNSMPFNMGMGLGMNPQTMNMNVPLNMNMGMGVPMSMPMMQMPMSMPFAGLQLGLTVSLSPHQHSAQQHQQHHAQQQQQNQTQQWMGGTNVNGGSQGGVPMEYDMASGMGMGGGGPMGEGMFSLVNGTPANTPLNSPLSPSAASIPSSMLGVLGGPGPSSSGPMSPESEKGPGAAATSSTLSYALG